jgi:hypothetical protein
MVPVRFPIAAEWSHVPELQLDLARLEYIDFLRTGDAAAKTAAPVEAAETAQPAAPEFPAPEPLPDEPVGLQPTPPRFEMLAALATTEEVFGAMEPQRPRLSPPMREVAFSSPEIVIPHVDLVTLHAAVTFQSKPAPDAPAQAPSPTQVLMTQEPPPTLPEVVPKAKHLAEGRKPKKPALTLRPAAKPNSVKPAAPVALAPKSKIIAPGPVDDAALSPQLPEFQPEFRPEPPLKPRPVVPHPVAMDAPVKGAIPKPGLVGHPVWEYEPVSAESSNDSETIGEVIGEAATPKLVPSWIKKILFVAVLGVGAFLDLKTGDQARTAGMAAAHGEQGSVYINE